MKISLSKIKGLQDLTACLPDLGLHVNSLATKSHRRAPSPAEGTLPQGAPDKLKAKGGMSRLRSMVPGHIGKKLAVAPGSKAAQEALQEKFEGLCAKCGSLPGMAAVFKEMDSLSGAQLGQLVGKMTRGGLHGALSNCFNKHTGKILQALMDKPSEDQREFILNLAGSTGNLDDHMAAITGELAKARHLKSLLGMLEGSQDEKLEARPLQLLVGAAGKLGVDARAGFLGSVKSHVQSWAPAHRDAVLGEIARFDAAAEAQRVAQESASKAHRFNGEVADQMRSLLSSIDFQSKDVGPQFQSALDVLKEHPKEMQEACIERLTLRHIHLTPVDRRPETLGQLWSAVHGANDPAMEAKILEGWAQSSRDLADGEAARLLSSVLVHAQGLPREQRAGLIEICHGLGQVERPRMYDEDAWRHPELDRPILKPMVLNLVFFHLTVQEATRPGGDEAARFDAFKTLATEQSSWLPADDPDRAKNIGFVSDLARRHLGPGQADEVIAMMAESLRGNASMAIRG